MIFDFYDGLLTLSYYILNDSIKSFVVLQNQYPNLTHRTHSEVSHVVLHVTPGTTAVMCNGRVVTPLARASPEDLQLIETLEISSGAGKKDLK